MIVINITVEECKDIAEWCDQGHQDCSIPDVQTSCRKHCGLCDGRKPTFNSRL